MRGGRMKAARGWVAPRLWLLPVLLLGAASSGCVSQPDVRSVWRMPGVTRPGEALPEGASGSNWVYASGPGSGADSAGASDHIGDLPDSMRPPQDALWLVDETLARRRARRLQLPLVIDFYADWCEPCTRMAAETFRDPQLGQQLGLNYVPLQVNVTEETFANREQLERYQVYQLPTLLVLAPNGSEQARYDRFVSADELSSRLAEVTERRSAVAKGADQAAPQPLAADGTSP